MRRLFAALLGLTALFCASTAQADTLTSQNAAFLGPNVYSPDVIYDAQVGYYKMWYGGWQTSGQTNDYIYYKTAASPTSWPNTYTTVLTPALVQQQYRQSTGRSISIVHVNDPALSKDYNNVNHSYQYTLFYDIATCTTGGNCNSLWSSVATDGISFVYAQPLTVTLPAGIGGPQNPDVVSDTSGPPGTVWHVYFSVSSGSISSIWMVYVDGNRNAIGAATQVFTLPGHNVQNPHVVLIGSTWHLFYNIDNPYGGYDIYQSLSSNDTSWTSTNNVYQVIGNNNNPICATQTPFALAQDATDYLLYFAPDSGGPSGCQFSQNTSIQIWGWHIP